jgi:hypothetical protein
VTLGPHQRPHFSAEDLELLQEVGGGLGPPAQHTLEMATARLYHDLLHRPANRAFLDDVLTGPERISEAYTAGIVPGAFYREHKNTGANGARVIATLQKLGIPTETIPVRSFGRLEENASIIRKWLRERRRARVVLVTLSKGGADCKAALRLGDSAEWNHVAAWLNLSGIVQGTPLIAWLRRQPLRLLGIRGWLWWHGQSFAAADDLRRGPSAPLGPWPEPPQHLRLIHVIAFPLRRHLRHPWAPRAYERLAPLGPNDGGGILLDDARHFPGVVCPVWGADHYLEPAWDVSPFLRNVILAALSPVRRMNPAIETAWAATPSAAPTTRSTK